MSILLGSQHVYTKQKCIKRDPKLTVPLSRILAQIKTELLKFNIKVQRPLKKDLPFCNSLWVRDPFINVNNKLLMLPLQTIVTRNVVEWKSIPAAASRRKAIFPESPENACIDKECMEAIVCIVLAPGMTTNPKTFRKHSKS